MWVIQGFFCMKTQQRGRHCSAGAALCNATIVPRSLQLSISSRWAILAGAVRQPFCRHRRAFCTSEAQCCLWAGGKQSARRKRFILSFLWPGLPVLAVERPFLRHTRSHVTIWVAPTCGGAIYFLPSLPSFILKQLFKSVWEARWEGGSLVYLQKLCWVISVYLRA